MGKEKKKKKKAKHEDAQLILRLYELRREEKLRAARDWFATQFFPESIEDFMAVFAPGNPQPVVIGRGVFIGARAIILKGVTIGDRAIVGAGAVVARDVPARHIAVGNPARVIAK